MYNRNKVLALAIVLLLPVVLIIAMIPRPSPAIEQPATYFSLASWDYPDEYGQGIDGFWFYENSTGSWLAAPYYTHYYPDYHEELGVFYALLSDQDNYILNWTSGVAMKLHFSTFLNMTLTGASDDIAGKDLLRFNVTVTDVYDTVLFTSDNPTYLDSIDGSDYGYDWAYYHYEIILDFIPQAGQQYNILTTYEVLC